MSREGLENGSIVRAFERLAVEGGFDSFWTEAALSVVFEIGGRMLIFLVLVTTNAALIGLATNSGAGKKMVESVVLVAENRDVVLEKRIYG